MTFPTSIIARPKVDLPHNRIHEGVFITFNVISRNILVDNPKYFLLKTPGLLPDGTAIFGHVIFSVSSNLGIKIELFEDAKVSNDGLSLPAFLNNRSPSSNIPLVTTGFTFENPTVTDEGNRIFVQLVGSAITGGIGGPRKREEEEFVFKIATKYLIKITPLIDGVDTTLIVSNYSNRSTPTPPIPP